MGEPAYSRRWASAAGASPTFGAGSTRWDFNSDTVRRQSKLLLSGGTRGTRARITKNTRDAPYDVLGTLTINPSPKFLGEFLVYALGGGTETAPAFADLLTEFALLADRGKGGYTLGDCYKYTGLKVNRLTLSGRATGLIECSIDVLGKAEAASQAFTGAALGTTLAYEPYVHSDLAFADTGVDALGGALRLEEWSLTIDNGLTASFATSLTADDILEGERLVTFSATAKVSAQVITALYSNRVKDGDTATLTLTNSTVSTAFSFAALQLPKQSLQTDGQEIILPLRGEIRGVAGNEFTVTNDVTP